MREIRPWAAQLWLAAALCLFRPATVDATAVCTEDFATEPSLSGWRVAGDASLFSWDESSQQLKVTWDSSRPNSFFFHSLGTVLAKTDDVSFAFDVELDDVVAGSDPAKPFTFELAVGFIHLQDALSNGFTRGTATQSPNLVEFDYFPDSGFGATISPTIVSSNNQFVPSFSFPLELTPRDLFHVEMNYTATNQTLNTVMLKDGQPFGPIKQVQLTAAFTDYRVDTVAISSYSDQNADGSILAHGAIDNVQVTVPDPPDSNLIGAFQNGHWQVTIPSRTGWTYTLERRDEDGVWRGAADPVAGTGEILTLVDLKSESLAYGIYRVLLDRP